VILNRALALATIISATVLLAVLMFGGGGGDYRLRAQFLNAGQVVKGGIVTIAGKQVGTVVGQRLTDDGLAELELRIDDDWAPLPAGIHAQIRQYGLSGPASRYIELRLPDAPTREHLADGAVLAPDQTTSNVDLDELFATFDARTRRALRGVFRGSARQYAGQGRNAAAGWVYLDPSLVAATRLFDEVNRDSDELRRFVRETAHLVGDLAEKREDLAGLVDNVADTTGAIVRRVRSPMRSSGCRRSSARRTRPTSPCARRSTVSSRSSRRQSRSRRSCCLTRASCAGSSRISGRR
jgi:phospholipid/cholesterol/gamma-HCH transport system substrate-binding protein